MRADRPSRRAALQAALALAAWTATGVQAHDFRVGDLAIDHPYATPSNPGVATGAVYFRGIRNRGRSADRLIAASTPVAERVELHRMRLDGEVMRMREIPAIDLPAGQTVPLRHGQPTHLMLLGLKQPLAVGDRFELRLRFAQAGETTVQVWVQQPRQRAAAAPHWH